MVKDLLTFTVKSVVYGGTIIGAGYLIMKATVPSNEDMAQRLRESGRASHFNSPEDKKKLSDLAALIKENAGSDRPAWDVRVIDSQRK